MPKSKKQTQVKGDPADKTVKDKLNLMFLIPGNQGTPVPAGELAKKWGVIAAGDDSEDSQSGGPSSDGSASSVTSQNSEASSGSSGSSPDDMLELDGNSPVDAHVDEGNPDVPHGESGSESDGDDMDMDMDMDIETNRTEEVPTEKTLDGNNEVLLAMSLLNDFQAQCLKLGAESRNLLPPRSLENLKKEQQYYEAELNKKKQQEARANGKRHKSVELSDTAQTTYTTKGMMNRN